MSPNPPEGFEHELCVALFEDRLHLAEDYVGLLSNEGIEWGLLGPRECDRLWDRHILNSLCVSPLIPQGSWVADIGSGAGLPGIALALSRPDLRIDLIEPMQRRVDFLELCIERLGLADSVRVLRLRAEEYQGGPPILTCRALSSVSGLVRMLSPLLGHAVLLAIKGARAEVEITAADAELTEHGLIAQILRPLVYGYVVGTVVHVHTRTHEDKMDDRMKSRDVRKVHDDSVPCPENRAV